MRVDSRDCERISNFVESLSLEQLRLLYGAIPLGYEYLDGSEWMYELADRVRAELNAAPAEEETNE